ncbi:hypothetical protein A3C20_02410 [Candidatus Kaiserbacteria bacterium RIFCSPHIGHO2_02_FULL_55_25]|uniref:Band 7 domain-containing protein n=2 Tax=Parcubacteria group TaxID=1794811 RepID=A0A1F4Y0L5_9BACT|nr:MAG: hypothetical protein A3B33_02410 [Candidatus Adlerbacteria bacterium RIFCSPLOWO2_01_FULL_54_16]OGG69839.1 MAG: hypothetical protein A3C20_02410 [Candidatus Kaiserbacteria bacterium RIFCSPHIGHO2_02_FULL_55_25]OGG78473.1 MAG: hypothetical protein A3F56_04105 [Candidatus Kaiserbacteria bacterium RIFCSPHIGHO2_12_FULL_55_13]
MRKLSLVTALTAAIAILSGGPSFAAELRAIPPDMIGLMLTPTGFDGKIYESGQVDIGTTTWWAGYGNKIVLIQRAGFQIKEQFVSNDPNNANDHEDHRCIVGPKRQPMSLDVRLLFALPDYTKPAGKEALLRMGLLGTPTNADPNAYGGNRVMVLKADSVYFQQVQQQVRGKIRDVCLSYADVEAVYSAVEKNGTDAGFTDTIKKAVGTVLAENRSPLFLIGAVASNVKPDPSVINAIAATQAADKLVEAMAKIDAFVKEDKTGTRAQIYKLHFLQEMNKANKSGQNNLLMMDISGGQQVLPLPQR